MQRLFRIISLNVLISGILLLILSILSIPRVQNYVKAMELQFEAKKTSPSSITAKRMRAMANALKNNKKTYSFQTNEIPPLGVSK